jgi:hypothetical protein
MSFTQARCVAPFDLIRKTNVDRTIKNFQLEIIKIASQKLGRKLTRQETESIASRGGFLALELIRDTVNSKDKQGIEEYLNSEGADRE